MNLPEAIELIRPAVRTAGGTWADLGAGTGLFTRALAALIGPAGRIHALDRDAGALSALRAAAGAHLPPGAEILPVEGDFLDFDRLDELVAGPLDGVLFANALHFAPDAGRVLTRVARLLRDEGRIVVVEYDRHTANRWVPYPVPAERLRLLASQVLQGAAQVVSRRPSAFGGTMYCAVVEGAPL